MCTITRVWPPFFFFFFKNPPPPEISTLPLHAALPIYDIGEYALNTGVPDTESTSMCQKRKGCPRSSVSRMGQISSSGKLMMKASREAALSAGLDRKSTRLNSSHSQISYAVFCLKKKKK